MKIGMTGEPALAAAAKAGLSARRKSRRSQRRVGRRSRVIQSEPGNGRKLYEVQVPTDHRLRWTVAARLTTIHPNILNRLEPDGYDRFDSRLGRHLRDGGGKGS